MFNSPSSPSEFKVNTTKSRINDPAQPPNLTAKGGTSGGGRPQTTLLSNNDHHPLVIEFEYEQNSR